MTYKEYDNIFLETGAMPCKIPIDLMTKNLRMVGWRGWGNQYIPETGEPRDFIMNLAIGEVTEIGSAHPWGALLWDEYVIGVGDYIYSTEEDGDGNIWIFEYCIPTQEKKSIFVWDWDNIAEPDIIFISYLELHKILVATSNANTAPSGYDMVYLLDFTQMTATLEIEATGLDVITVLYTQTINGSLMGFMGGLDENYEYFVMYCKNITNDGEWLSTTFPTGELDTNPRAYWYENWQVCNNRYLCTTIFIDATETPPLPCRLQIICYNMETQAWQASNIADAYDFYPEPYYDWTYWVEPYYTSGTWGNIMATDMTDGKLYIAHNGWNDWTSEPYGNPTHRKYTNYFQFFGVYDPTTNLLSVISSPGWTTYNTSGTGSTKTLTCVYTTPQHAYFGFFDNNILYGTDMSILSTHTPDWWGTTTIMDNNSIFYESLADERTIQATDINGNILRTWDLGEDFYWTKINTVGNGIVVQIDQNNIEYIRRQFLLT